MIDPKLFTVERLLDAMFDSMFGNRDHWRGLAEIVPDYMPPYPRADTRPSVVVRVPHLDDDEYSYLRGPAPYFWDIYGDNFREPERALLALLDAPVPPSYQRKEVWERRRLQDFGKRVT